MRRARQIPIVSDAVGIPEFGGIFDRLEFRWNRVVFDFIFCHEWIAWAIREDLFNFFRSDLVLLSDFFDDVAKPDDCFDIQRSTP